MEIRMRLVFLTVSCVIVWSQSTTEDNQPSFQLQLQMKILEQQHQQMASELRQLIDNQLQQQIIQLNALQTMLQQRVARCMIDVLAYSANNNCTAKYGHVKLDGVAVLELSWCGRAPNRRGVHVLLVNAFSCSVTDSGRFDTHAESTAAAELRRYLEEASRGTVIVAVSADEPSSLLRGALSTLTALGANVTDVGSRGSFAFIAQKGFPEKTVLRKALSQAASLANQPHLNASITGCSVDYLSITVV